MKKNTLLFLLMILTPIIAIGQVSFTTQSISVSGTDLAAVDMNGDNLDDLVGVTSSTITIYYQQPDGTFNSSSYSIDGDYSPSWSLAAGDYNADGFNDLIWGDSSGAQVFRYDPSATGAGRAWAARRAS